MPKIVACQIMALSGCGRKNGQMSRDDSNEYLTVETVESIGPSRHHWLLSPPTGTYTCNVVNQWTVEERLSDISDALIQTTVRQPDPL
jgi:hypothetical protein